MKSRVARRDGQVMNYFAHAYRFLDDPYFALGTGVPDWLAVVDRKVRVRPRRLEPFTKDACHLTAAIARGALQHLQDDARFHQGPAFAEVSIELSQSIRRATGHDTGFRSAFLGHLLTELLLDDHLIDRHPDRLEVYYRVLDDTRAVFVETVVNRMATGETDRLARLIRHFGAARVLSDYADDDRLFGRVNQVLSRVGFEPVDHRTFDIFPSMRAIVSARADDLLAWVERQ